MIIPAILWTFKGELLIGLVALGSTVAISEIILGQLIAAIAPTLMVVIALVTLMKGQKQMLIGLDGKLDALIAAKESAAKSAGKEEERVEARARQGEAAIAQTQASDAPAEVIVKNPENDPAHVKTV